MSADSDGSGARPPEPTRSGFRDVLARARGPAGDASRSSRAAVHGDPRGHLLRTGRGGRLPAPPASAPARDAAPAELLPDPPPVAELAAVARALPPAIAAARSADGPVSLSFGRSLDVELRSTGAGVELLLRPEPRLARAAEAELPRVVAALRVRGVAVARAEVRPRGGGRAR